MVTTSAAIAGVMVMLVASQGGQLQQQFIMSDILQLHFPFQLANTRLPCVDAQQTDYAHKWWTKALEKIVSQQQEQEQEQQKRMDDWCRDRNKKGQNAIDNLKRLDVLRMLCPLHFRVLVTGQQSELGLSRP